MEPSCKDVRNTSEYFGLFSYIYDGTVGHVTSRYVFPFHVMSHVFSCYESCIESCYESCIESCYELCIESCYESHVESYLCKSHKLTHSHSLLFLS